MALFGSSTTEKDIIDKLDKYSKQFKEIYWKRHYSQEYIEKIINLINKTVYVAYTISHFYYKPLSVVYKNNKDFLKEAKSVEDLEELSIKYENAIKDWDKKMIESIESRIKKGLGFKIDEELTKKQIKSLGKIKELIVNYDDTPKNLYKKIKKILKNEEMIKIFDVLLSNIIYHCQNFDIKKQVNFEEQVKNDFTKLEQVYKTDYKKVGKKFAFVAPWGLLFFTPLALIGILVYIGGGTYSLITSMKIKKIEEGIDATKVIDSIRRMSRKYGKEAESVDVIVSTLTKILTIYELRKDELYTKKYKQKFDNIDNAFKFISKNLE